MKRLQTLRLPTLALDVVQLQLHSSNIKSGRRVSMFPRRMVLLGLFYCCIKTGGARRRTKELFPAASRVKRGLTAAVNPTFYSSFSDAHLLFEILINGAHFEPNGAFSVEDAELSSLQKTRNLDVICEEIIPKKLTDILRLIANLSDHKGHLQQDDFERTLLTLVFTSQQVVNSTSEHQREVWAQSFVGLYKAIKEDLTETN